MSSSATTSLIQAVLQASKRTFARSRNRFKLKEEDFVSSLRDLKCLLDNVRTHDLGKQKKIAKITQRKQNCKVVF